MKNASQIGLLVNISMKAVDKAILDLGMARNNYSEAEKKLNELIGFRADYKKQLDSLLCKGISSASWYNFEQFITTIDKAIIQQRKLLITLDKVVEEAIGNWQNAEKRKKAYHILEEKNIRREQQQIQKREQKMMDEFSSRIFIKGGNNL